MTTEGEVMNDIVTLVRQWLSRPEVLALVVFVGSILLAKVVDFVLCRMLLRLARRSSTDIDYRLISIPEKISSADLIRSEAKAQIAGIPRAEHSVLRWPVYGTGSIDRIKIEAWRTLVLESVEQFRVPEYERRKQEFVELQSRLRKIVIHELA